MLIFSFFLLLFKIGEINTKNDAKYKYLDLIVLSTRSDSEVVSRFDSHPADPISIPRSGKELLSNFTSNFLYK